MAEIRRVTLFGKLGTLAYRTIESGTVFCKLRGNPHVELVHWLHQILEGQDSDLHRIVRRFSLGRAALARDLIRALDALPRRADGVIDLSSHVEEAVERAWVYASLLFDAEQVRTGHLLVGLLKTPSLYRELLGISLEFKRIDCELLTGEFDALLHESPEAQGSAAASARIEAAPGEASGAIAPAPMGKQQALARYTVDFTALAREGKLDPIIGRSDEVRQIIDILLRRRQNNPILTGEAGVGKTAVVEGLAQRIVSGNIAPPLRGVSLRALDVGLLQAGASMKGEFEQRLRQVIEEAQQAQPPVILFIDEAHTLIGAGGAAGTGDAANLLKPALARGTLRTIAATTWAEYKRYIEKDPALVRRFQPVVIREPDEAKALGMLRGLVPAMEAHHGVLVLDEALHAAVTLSARYIADRQLPDKAVSLIDTVCARVAASHYATPPALELARETIAALDAERESIERETAWGADRQGRSTAVAERLALERANADALDARWHRERALVDTIRELHRRLCDASELPETAGSIEAAVEAVEAVEAGESIEGGAYGGELESEVSEPHAGQTQQEALAALERAERELRECQGDTPLVMACVDRHAVAAVVQDWTGIPVGRMVGDEVETLLDLARRLDARIVGQSHATARIARCVQTARAGLNRPGRPLGVFLLAGPSGVGKTETALALAGELYGGEHNLITLNMSEYQEAHTVSTLKGAPPGYVGYGEGGVLTEAVRRRPHSVILLDEVEKAHRDVHELFYQVFDKGWMEDGEGRVIDFRNTLILLTTNVGTELVMRACADALSVPAEQELAAALRAPLLRVFAPALLGRMTTIPYYPLDEAALRAIVRLQLARVQDQMNAQHAIALSFDEAVVTWIVGRCDENDSGARLVDAVIAQRLLPEIGQAMLARQKSGTRIEGVEVSVAADAIQCMFF